MSKNQKIKRSAVTGRFVAKPLGASKASKFSSVEGLALSAKSKRTPTTLKSSGLKGDALRSAISGTFKK